MSIALPLPMVHQGKVRDSYMLQVLRPPYRLPLVSRRISVFDFVLGFEIPFKDEVLCAMNILIRLYLKECLPELKQDLVAYGHAIDGYLPLELRENPGLQKVATVVRICEIPPIEAIVRGYLTGTGYDKYVETGQVCGHVLPPGLLNGAKLPEPLYTPTTKAKVGHDEHLPYQEVNARYGEGLGQWSLRVYRCLAELAESRGLIVADTKLEFDSLLCLCDEAGTADSSRYWSKAEYEKCQPGQLPPSLDKQFVRDWGKRHGLHDPTRFDPKNADHRMAVKALQPPPGIIEKTTEIYLAVFQQMAQMSLRQFQKEVMNIKL